MGVRQTSLETFYELKESGNLNKLQEIVFNYFIEYPCSTDKEISELSEIPINIITARRNELVKIGKLQEYNRRECMVTGRKAITWCK